ncbi:pyridoxal phosphate-dependent aminotransferase [Nakamurella lactea]|uniref:pyridoxal phosphate-dependent aminotransferase n=1 Tax=Nakamurella lactea TaxID=459515 RepID=UPI00040FD32D|nr:pyridoxal phosphate-dependent aminotransferase [Nakamurella lactea]
MAPIIQSRKLADVCYDIRGPVLSEAHRMEASGHRLIKLNIGNPAPFGFEAPDEILQDVIASLSGATGYSESKGIQSARRAVAQHYQAALIEAGQPELDVENIYLGNGVSELIVMSLQAMLDDGDEVLVPAPDYPLWTASVSLSGGSTRHYRCDESNGWQPDLEHMASLITERTKAIVVINPNNPTGAVYSRQTLEGIVALAREHELVLMADEIYEKILYDDAVHVPLATLAPDVVCLTFNGLSKAYRLAGFRSGWLTLTGPLERAVNYREGLDILANMRLCPNVPAQHAVATALGGRQSIKDLVLPSGRLGAQRDAAVELVNGIDGLSTTTPRGALYIFPRLDPERHPIVDDEAFALDLLREQKVLIVQGTGFNWSAPDHFRIVTLPHVEVLTEAIGRIGEFLAAYRPRLRS